MANAGAPIVVGDVARWYCKATQLTAQALAAATFTAVTFDNADDVDNLGIHDPVTNNSRFQIGLALGWWLVIGSIATPAGTVARGSRSRLLLNGTTGQNGGYSAQPSVTPGGGFWTSTSIALVQATAAADYVQLQAYSDTALTMTVSGDLRSSMTCIYQGP